MNALSHMLARSSLLQEFQRFSFSNQGQKSSRSRMTEAATGGVLLKKGMLKNFTIFIGRQLCWSLFVIKLLVFRPVVLLKRYPSTEVFYVSEYCKVSKNTYFEEHLPAAVSNLFGVNK